MLTGTTHVVEFWPHDEADQRSYPHPCSCAGESAGASKTVRCSKLVAKLPVQCSSVGSRLMRLRHARALQSKSHLRRLQVTHVVQIGEEPFTWSRYGVRKE